MYKVVVNVVVMVVVIDCLDFVMRVVVYLDILVFCVYSFVFWIVEVMEVVIFKWLIVFKDVNYDFWELGVNYLLCVLVLFVEIYVK